MESPIELIKEVKELREEVKELREAQKYNFRVIDKMIRRLAAQIHRGFTHVLK